MKHSLVVLAVFLAAGGLYTLFGATLALFAASVLIGAYCVFGDFEEEVTDG